jgi:hypothetical protein
MGLWATTCSPLFVDRRLPLVGWNEQSGDIVDSSASDGVSGYCAGGLLGEQHRTEATWKALYRLGRWSKMVKKWLDEVAK